MNNITDETKVTIFYIFIAFTFSVVVRLFWVYDFNGYEPFMFNNQFMINTNDGYFWAEGARDLLSGVSQPHDLSPVTTAASQLTAFFAMVLPFSFESVILYMPVFLSSLVVIPMMLIAKSVDNLEMGLIASLLASIAWSYYNRTMVGYYDTDMLNIVLPMFLLWSIIWAFRTNEDKFLLITAIDILIYRWWYPQSYALEFSFFGLILLYFLVIDGKKAPLLYNFSLIKKNSFYIKLLAIMMLAMINVDGYIRFPLVIGAYFLFKQEKSEKYLYHILAISVMLFFATGGFDPIWNQLKGYVFKDAIAVGEEGLQLHFYSVMQTIREAGQIPFETFANRISGHTITFSLSIIGYMWLVYKKPIFLLGLPMIGLGFLASVGGLRFTIYAVPILAFGIAFLITEGTRFITDKKSIMAISYVAFTIAILYPNIKHVEEYKVPTVFNSTEVDVLQKLHKIATREDYVLGWWDYGYPIRYYSDVKTVADGGKHSGQVNFPLSFTLTNPPHVASKMARLDVEYTEQGFTFSDAKKDGIIDENITRFSNIEEMTKDYGFDDTNDFLYSLQTDIKLPKKTRDIYFYLPYKMLDIYPTVKIFSNLNLMNGEQSRQPLFFVSRGAKETQTTLEFGRGVSMDKRDFSLLINNQKRTIKRFVKTGYDKSNKFIKSIRNIDANSNLNVIFMSAYNTFIILDESSYNSTYIQLSVLESYDTNLFEQVITTPFAKVYKLKI